MRAFDSHGTSLVLTGTLALCFTAGSGFFSSLILLLTALPFIFDGVMALISIRQGRILAAVPVEQPGQIEEE